MPINKGYYPHLDGLRAVAVILVLLVHSGFFAFNIGWIGVPVFFVLSGFLITGILLDNRHSEHYFSTFYLRRILRIFPIYYLVLFFLFAWGLIMNYDVSQFFYYLFYLQSFTISANQQPIFANGLMGHTWSLSVEEIFYLIWPAIVFMISRKNLGRTCFVLIAFSIAFKLYQVKSGTETMALLSVFGNLDCLMTGALLSLYLDKNNFPDLPVKLKLYFLTISLATLLLIISQYVNFDARLRLLFKILLSVSVSWFSFFLIMNLIQSGAKAGFVSKILTNNSVLFLGKISYGIYLYHVPVYEFISSFIFHYHIPLNPVMALLIKISITILIAAISWRLIEKPILRLKNKWQY